MSFLKTFEKIKIAFNQNIKKTLIPLFATSLVVASTVAIVLPVTLYKQEQIPHQTINLKKIGTFKNDPNYPEVYIEQDKSPTEFNVLRFMNVEPNSALAKQFEFTGWSVFGTKIEQDPYVESCFELDLDLNSIPKFIAFDGVENTVKNIGFFRSKNMTSVTIPDFIEVIGKNAFMSQNNPSITKLDLSQANKLVKISESAFAYCDKLTGNLIIPASVTTIGKYAFSSGVHFKKIEVNPLNSKYALASHQSVGTANVVIDKTIAPGINYDYNSEPVGNLVCGEVKVPSNVTAISKQVFSFCSGLTGLDFSDATNLQIIDENAFISCTNLSNQLIFPSNLTTIGKYAFENCPKLTGELIFPLATTRIGSEAFKGTNFTEINFQHANPLVMSVGMDAFAKPEQLNDQIIICVPTSGLALWQNFPGITKILGIVDINQIQPK